MNTQWAEASQQASRPMKWYDIATIILLAAGAIVALVGWLIFDGTRAL